MDAHTKTKIYINPNTHTPTHTYKYALIALGMGTLKLKCQATYLVYTHNIINHDANNNTQHFVFKFKCIQHPWVSLQDEEAAEIS